MTPVMLLTRANTADTGDNADPISEEEQQAQDAYDAFLAEIPESKSVDGGTDNHLVANQCSQLIHAGLIGADFHGGRSDQSMAGSGQLGPSRLSGVHGLR